MSKLTTGLSPLTVEARDYDAGTFPVDAFEFSPSGKYVGLKAGWGFRTSLLTLSGAGSPFYSPVSTEGSWGVPHGRNGSLSAWDKTTSTAFAGLDTWDLSGLLPLGTTRIWVVMNMSRGGTAEFGHGYGGVWDYDRGSSLNAYDIRKYGGFIFCPGKAATTATTYSIIEHVCPITIGSSRKLYVGVSDTNWVLSLLYRDYDI